MDTEISKLHNRGGTRLGAGRPKGSTKAGGLATRMMRVSTQITKDQVDAIPELIDRLNHWEEEYLAAKERGESCRTYEKMLHLIEELRILGY
jgi:hypothetical protein